MASDDVAALAAAPDELRRLVAEVLAEVLPTLARSTGSVGPSETPLRAASLGGEVAAGGGGDGESWTVRLGSDDELHAFVLRVLRLSDNPKLRRDLISGRIRFSLAAPSGAGAVRPVHRVDKGAVTERIVAAAATVGARLVLGRRAVLTPLARDKARAMGVPIEKER